MALIHTLFDRLECLTLKIKAHYSPVPCRLTANFREIPKVEIMVIRIRALKFFGDFSKSLRQFSFLQCRSDIQWSVGLLWNWAPTPPKSKGILASVYWLIHVLHACEFSQNCYLIKHWLSIWKSQKDCQRQKEGSPYFFIMEQSLSIIPSFQDSWWAANCLRLPPKFTSCLNADKKSN